MCGEKQPGATSEVSARLSQRRRRMLVTGVLFQIIATGGMRVVGRVEEEGRLRPVRTEV